MMNPLTGSIFERTAYRCLIAVAGIAAPLRRKPSADVEKFREKAAEAAALCSKRGIDTAFCILADMSLHSGVKRLAVWDCRAGRIVFKSLVSHGSGDESTRGLDTTKQSAVFSDTPGSLLTCCGVFLLAEKYSGKYGVSFRLDGLSPTNSRARQRAIVLHAYRCIPDFEIFPHGTAESAGCPAVSTRTMRKIEKLSRCGRISMYIYGD